VVRQRKGTRLSSTAPSNTYTTRDNHSVVIGANNDAIFRRFCKAMGRADLADDPRFQSNPDRLRHVELLDEVIGNWVRSVDRDDLLQRLQAADVPASPIYSVADIVQDQHYWAREMLLRVQDPRLGPVVVPGVVPKLAASPGGQQWLGPRLGEHTDSVLRDVLGVATEEIAELRGKGLV